MVIATLILVIINTILTGTFCYLTLIHFKKQPKVTKCECKQPVQESTKKEEPVPEEPTSEIMYSLAKNIQTKWYDLNEDDNER